MNTIVAGCGLISSRWLRALLADPRIIVSALVDPDRAAAEQLAERFGLCDLPWFTELDAALAAVENPEILVNLTPADVHAACTRVALMHGLHVFTEKPLALRLDEAQELVRLARGRGRVLAVMNNRGSDARFVALCDLVRSLGPGPYAVSARICVRLSRAGFRRRLDHPALQDLAVHAFDQIQQLIPAAPITISAAETPLPLQGGHCSLATAVVRFTDDSVFAFHGGFTGEGHQTSADGEWWIDLAGAGCRWDGRQRATVFHQPDRPGHSDPPDHVIAVDLPAVGGHGPHITAMIDAVNGEPACADGLGSIALLDAALCSARIGAPVTVQEAQS